MAGTVRTLSSSPEVASGCTYGRMEQMTSDRTEQTTSDCVWQELTKASFAVVSYVTPSGEPRSSGVVYAIAARRMYVVAAVDSWKAQHIGATGQVAVTVPVRRGGIMSLLAPIPPATISFHGSAIVHPASAVLDGSLPKKL